MPAAVDFDYVAVALVDRAPFWPVLAGDLGGRWVGGFAAPGGFAFPSCGSPTG